MKRIKVGVAAVIAIVALMMTERIDVVFLYGISAIMHEAGHLIAAKLRCIRIKEISLGISGVRICTEEGAGSYLDEFILCAAGPLVNVLAIIVGAVVLWWRQMSVTDAIDALVCFIDGRYIEHYGALVFFMLCSLLQGGLNLLPVKSFDGGRMLYCLCAATLGQGAAERVVGITGALCMLVIWIAALYFLLKIGAGLSIFTFASAIFLGTLCDRELIEWGKK